MSNLRLPNEELREEFRGSGRIEESVSVSSPTALSNKCHHVEGLHTEDSQIDRPQIDGNQIKVLQINRKGTLTRGISIRRRRRTFWIYNGNFEFWWKGSSEGWSAIEFKLTDEIKKKFEGALLVKHSEVDDVQLLDILQSITNLESSRSSDAKICQFCFMSNFLEDIQKVNNPAAAGREHLVEDCVGSKVPGHLISSIRYFGPLRVLGLSCSLKSNHSALARAMESGNLRSLETLLLNKTSLGDDDCEVYAKALESGRVEALTQMYLSYNEIGDSGVAALARALRSGHMKSLLVIDLSANRIEDVGTVALASAFQSGQVRNLRTISLSVNMIGDVGMVKLAASLEAGQFTDLRHLYLGYNRFGVKGISRLARALESGNLNSLIVLHLKLPEKASLTEEYAKPLLQAFHRNPCLTVDVDSNADSDESTLQSQMNRQRERNLKRVELLSAAGGREVPATFGKVYLCGNPEVGKTTLRRSLQRTQIESLYTWERREHVEPRTRGIDICQITSKAGSDGKKPVSLTIWDMAGQNDYHLVHNAFLSDLSYAEGKATIFVVMCSSHNEVRKAEKELENWFKFIASSVNQSFPNKRDVLVVVNRMNGDSAILDKAVMKEWKRMISSQARKFESSLKITADPFVIDVRKRYFVQPFKQSLIELSRKMLEKIKVPEICHIVQGYLSDWVQSRRQFPVLPWVQVQAELQKRGADWPEETLEAAVKYLNEAGVLIYIDKKFPEEWDIKTEKLVVADPNWLCKEILGNMFLPERMGVSTSRLFKDMVHPNTGSIPISQFKQYFGSLEGVVWDKAELDYLLAILLWMGFCFNGRKGNIFIPALIHQDDEERKRVGFWNIGDSPEHRQGQWIVGFSVEHVTSQTALAPMALWHRFEVELAQIPRFNGQTVDSDFVAGKYFVTFKVEYMVVLIQVNASEIERPTFDYIEVLVKPLRNCERDQLDVNTRKQRQVDLAGDIVKKLVDLWEEVCPGMGYVQRIVWPWPSSLPRCPSMPERNLEVAKLKIEVEQHGGRELQWTVGDQDIITEDQLLPTKDKETMKSVKERRIREGRKSIQRVDELREALGVRSLEEVNHEAFTMDKPNENGSCEASLSQICATSSNDLTANLEEILKNTREIQENARLMRESHRDMSESLKSRYHQFFQKVDDFERTFLEDKENICPRIMYLGEKNSNWWVRLKDLEASPIGSAHVHFQCEANYNDGGPHAVRNQEGIDVSHLKDWARKLAPWIKHSVKFLLAAAQGDANIGVPGLGLAISNFTQWPQVSLVADGIFEFTGFTEQELEDLINSEVLPQGVSTIQNPEELYGQSRKVMAEILGKLTVQDYKEKLGLQKVLLRNFDRSLIGVRWICNDCHQKYREEHLVTEL